jgi:hypothetical protein
VIEIPEATRDAELLLSEKDLNNMLRQEKTLELEYQLKLEQLAAWRRGKQGGSEGAPQAENGTGVSGFGSEGGGADSPSAAKRGLGRGPGRPRPLPGPNL